MTFGFGIWISPDMLMRALKATILWRLKVHFWRSCTKCDWSKF